MRWLSGARARLGLLFFRRAERRMDQEFQFHLEMQAEQNMRSGMTPDEARRLARAAFGGVEAHKEEMRDGRSLAAFNGLSLDVKLGLRMLAKYPGLAIVGGFGIAVAVAIGTSFYAFTYSYLYPRMPLDQGEQVVTLKNTDTRLGGRDDPRLLHDFVAWRGELTRIVDLGAFRTTRRNLVGASGPGEPLVIAEMSASGFRVARVPPLLGRTLLEADEAPGANPVIVIGYDAWQKRFGGDSAIVGQTIRVGRVLHTIVGVMPPGFAFPLNHSYWIPFRADPAAYPVGEGPDLNVFGRIAPGVMRGEAQAELSLMGQRMAAAQPETHATLRPRVLPYTDVFADSEAGTGEMLGLQALALLVLVLICGNVAILIYARTVTRSGEIAVRSALGASRRRIVTQLFAEALVLSLVAAGVGLGFVAIALRFVDYALTMLSAGGALPFWIVPGISAGTVAYAGAIAVLSAVIIGVVPGLKATGPNLRAAISQLKGGSKARLGGTWTGLIITQVAITVAILPPALVVGGEVVRAGLVPPSFAAEEVLSARFILEREGNAFSDRDIQGPEFIRTMGATQGNLMARLEGVPAVAGVTFADGSPGSERESHVQVEGRVRTAAVGTSRVGLNFLDVFGVGVVAGRGFVAADLALADRRPVIVNRRFVNDALGGGNALGRRVSFPTPGPAVGRHTEYTAGEVWPWHTIVGVVDEFPTGVRELDDPLAKVYLPAARGELQGATLLVRLRGITPSAFAPTLRTIATQVDPMLELRRVEPLDVVYSRNRDAMWVLAVGLVIALGSVVLLSTAGIYALMSFTVNQRRREIGVRVALGAGAGGILRGVLYRATLQLTLGVMVGLSLTVAVDVATGALLNGQRAVVIPAVAAFMVLLGLLAAAGPARRGLQVPPTEALRAE